MDREEAMRNLREHVTDPDVTDLQLKGAIDNIFTPGEHQLFGRSLAFLLRGHPASWPV